MPTAAVENEQILQKHELETTKKWEDQLQQAIEEGMKVKMTKLEKENTV